MDVGQVTTKIVHVSDTHGLHRDVGPIEGDIFIHVKGVTTASIARALTNRRRGTLPTLEGRRNGRILMIGWALKSDRISRFGEE